MLVLLPIVTLLTSPRTVAPYQTLTLTERIRRWLELSELASELGYTMPRNQHYVKRYIEILTTINDRPKEYKKISIAPIHD